LLKLVGDIVRRHLWSWKILLQTSFFINANGTLHHLCEVQNMMRCWPEDILLVS